MKIIRNREIVDDCWVHVADDTPLPEEGDIIVSLERWRSDREALLARSGRLGVSVPNTLDPTEIAADLGHFAVVAIPFPKYKDGRGYSVARLLRRQGFQGELRATGDVLRDQLFYMERCGFGAYELKEGKSLESALDGFTEFSVTYQDTVEPRSVPRAQRWRRA